MTKAHAEAAFETVLVDRAIGLLNGADLLTVARYGFDVRCGMDVGTDLTLGAGATLLSRSERRLWVRGTELIALSFDLIR